MTDMNDASKYNRFKVNVILTLALQLTPPPSSQARGLLTIIAGAGGAAHLPGMVAAMTPLPVIGVPVKSTALSGNDSLLSIVQMPRGVPVATVAITNAANAGLLAVRMLGMSDATLRAAMSSFMAKQEAEVLAKAEKLEQGGFRAYLGE